MKFHFLVMSPQMAAVKLGIDDDAFWGASHIYIFDGLDMYCEYNISGYWADGERLGNFRILLGRDEFFSNDVAEMYDYACRYAVEEGLWLPDDEIYALFWRALKSDRDTSTYSIKDWMDIAVECGQVMGQYVEACIEDEVDYHSAKYVEEYIQDTAP